MPEWIDGGARVAFLHRDEGNATDLDAIRIDDGAVKTLVPDFPGEQFSFQPPPGGGAGACADPGPPQVISCTEALQRVADNGFPGGAGSRIDATLVRETLALPGPGSDGPERWMWAVRCQDIHAKTDGEPVLEDWVVPLDAQTGDFVGEGAEGQARPDPNPPSPIATSSTAAG
jgi:hypothetical protein